MRKMLAFAGVFSFGERWGNKHMTVSQRPHLWVISALACVCALLGASTLHADGILLGDSHQYPYTSGTFVYSGGAAQQFYLNQSVVLTQINFGVASDSWLPDQIYLFQLSTKLGPDTSTKDVLMSFTTTDGFGIPGSLVDPFKVPSYLSFPVPSAEIDPGTYYLTDALIVNNPPHDTGGSFWYGTAPLDSSIGSLGQAYSLYPVDASNPAASPYQPLQLAPLDFQLIGHTVPEPPSWMLTVIGLISLIVLKRRTRYLTMEMAGKDGDRNWFCT